MSSRMQLSFVALLALVALNATAIPAQDAAKKAKGRLPAYYKDVVTPAQRDKIYAIQARFNADIDKLQAQLKELTAKRDAEVEGVLSATQKERVKEARDAARRPKAEPAAKPAGAAAAK